MNIQKISSLPVTVYDGFMADYQETYTMRLIEGKFNHMADAVKYQNKNFNKMVQGFFSGPTGTKKYDKNIFELSRYIHRLKRLFLNQPNGFIENNEAKFLEKKFSSGEEADMIHELAWAVVHSFSTGVFYDLKRSVDVIRKIISYHEGVIGEWNKAVLGMIDIDEDVKKSFKIRNESNEFLEHYTDAEGNLNEEDSMVFNTEQFNAENERPEEEDAQNFSNYRQAMENDKPKQKQEEVVTQIPIEKEPPVQGVTFTTVKNEYVGFNPTVITNDKKDDNEKVEKEAVSPSEKDKENPKSAESNETKDTRVKPQIIVDKTGTVSISFA